MQQWWSASEKDEQSVEDTISAKYTKVEVIYEYAAGETPAETTTTEPEQQPENPVRGDVNADKSFNVADAVAMQKYLLTTGTLKDWQAGDMDGNKKINAVDFSLMKRELLTK